MKLISTDSVVRQLHEQTLDQLWHEAEQLGRIEVDTSWRDEGYTVTIKFERRSGTSIRAVGKDSLISFAVSKAIDEARIMGAGVEQ